jgi:hypothetical protein
MSESQQQLNGGNSSSKPQQERPSSPARRRRWLESFCCLVMGFSLRSLYDVGFRNNGYLQQFLTSCGPLEIKNNEYHPNHHNGISTLNTTTSGRPLLNDNGLEFIFTIGLEGTGHHFMETTIKSSPAFLTIRSWGLFEYVTKAIMTLFRNEPLNGLWNMPCRDETMYVKSGKKFSLSSRFQGKKDLLAEFNTVKIHQQLVTLLQKMQTIYDEKTVHNPQPLRIPLNTYAVGSTANSGMMSYPNFRGKCYMLHYPVLELLYNACDDAGVQCSHVYVYRHPLDVLRSTTVKRPFNPPGMVSAAHLYTSHLKLMESQMRQFPERTRGCLGFFDRDGTDEWQDVLRDMWGWTFKNQTRSFDEFIRSKYKKPTKYTLSTSDNIFAEEIEGIFPPEHMPYLELFLKTHEQTLEVCRQSLLQRRYKR